MASLAKPIDFQLVLLFHCDKFASRKKFQIGVSLYLLQSEEPRAAENMGHRINTFIS